MQYTKEAIALIKEILSDEIIADVTLNQQTEQIQFIVKGNLASIQQREQLEERLKSQNLIKNWAVLVEYKAVPQARRRDLNFNNS